MEAEEGARLIGRAVAWAAFSPLRTSSEITAPIVFLLCFAKPPAANSTSSSMSSVVRTYHSLAHQIA